MSRSTQRPFDLSRYGVLNMGKPAKSPLSARIPSSLMDEVKAYCKRHNLTQADFTTMAIQFYLESQAAASSAPAAAPVENASVENAPVPSALAAHSAAIEIADLTPWQTTIEARLAHLEAKVGEISPVQAIKTSQTHADSGELQEDKEAPKDKRKSKTPRTAAARSGSPGSGLPESSMKSIASAVETFQKQTTQLGGPRTAPDTIDIDVNPVVVPAIDDEIDEDMVLLNSDQAWRLARQRGYLGGGDRAFLRRWERWGAEQFRRELGLERIGTTDRWIDLWS
ncbi:MAG: hypothetical protein ACO4CG_03250 [Prochlorothrix sp.]